MPTDSGALLRLEGWLVRSGPSRNHSLHIEGKTIHRKKNGLEKPFPCLSLFDGKKKIKIKIKKQAKQLVLGLLLIYEYISSTFLCTSVVQVICKQASIDYIFVKKVTMTIPHLLKGRAQEKTDRVWARQSASEFASKDKVSWFFIFSKKTLSFGSVSWHSPNG